MMKKTSLPEQTTYQRNLQRTLQVLAWIILIAALILVVTTSLSYEFLKTNIDKLAADGSVESFTETVYHDFFPLIRGFSLAAGLFAIVLLVWRKRFATWLLPFWQPHGSLYSHFVTGWKDFITQLRESFSDRSFWLAIFTLTMLSFLARIMFLQQPMRHDEAYSITVFAMQPFKNAIADYHVPNNHVFHTVLVYLSYHLFGAHVWAVRLPAFLAGVLVAPAGYITARKFYQPAVAWLAGVTMVVTPVLIDYATNARGYSLTTLFFLLMLWLAAEVKNRHNLFYWSLFILFGALGFYTLPIMLYPIGIAYTWMGLAWLIKDFGNDYDRSRFLKYILVSGVIMVVLGLLLYLPVFRSNGLQAFFANEYVEKLDWVSFRQTFVERMRQLWSEWTRYVPPIAVWLYLLGMPLSVFLHQRLCKERIPTQLAAAIFLPLILLIQKPNPWAKIWQFFLPLTIIWAAAGLLAVFTYARAQINVFKWKKPLPWWVNFVLTIALLITSFQFALSQYPGLKPWQGDVERAALYLKDQLEPGDLVVITATDDAPMWYYFAQYDLPEEALRRDIPFERAFVVVSTNQGQTPQRVIEERGPDLVMFDWQTLEKVAHFGNIDVYQIDADESVIRKEFGSQQP